jgi:hypothetical protein
MVCLCPECVQQFFHVLTRGRKVIGANNEVGARALFGIGHLPRKEAFERVVVHPRSCKNAAALFVRSGGDNGDPVDHCGPVRFKQKGDVEQNDIVDLDARPETAARSCATSG